MMSHVLVPTIFTSEPMEIPAPTAPICASNAPTATATFSERPSFFAQAAER